MTLPIPTEDREQMRVVKYLEDHNCKFTSIPNSTFTRSWKQKKKNTDMGLRAGFPDLVIIANGTFLCIEMKRSVGGVVSKLQAAWHSELKAVGIPIHVCNGYDEAKAVLDSYLYRSRR